MESITKPLFSTKKHNQVKSAMKKLALSFIILICISFFYSAVAVQLAGGYHFSLNLKEDGTILGCGFNAHGQLADGSSDDRLTPVQVVTGLSDVILISAGFFHSLAVKRDGTVWAWGGNWHGELGDGTVGEKRYTPVQVVGLSRVIAIDGGDYFSLAVKNDGTVWAWGYNALGELGDGTTTSRLTPVQVIGLSDAIAVSAGGDHSLALKRDGTVWAWGVNINGQLGDGTGGSDSYSPYTNIYSSLPVQTLGLSNVIAISAGNDHSLALKRDGTVWAWGYNEYGQIGDGNSGYSSKSPVPVQSPVSGVIAIQGGYTHSLVLASYGTVWFWGAMDGSIWSPIPVPVDGFSGVIAIAGGYGHALAVKNDGTVWAWGANTYGELGDGTSLNDRRYPAQVKEFSIGGSASVPASVLAADFDEDGKADPTAVSSSGELFYWNSSQSFSREGPIELGMAGKLAAGDANGDGQPDLAVVQAANWYFFLSSSNGYSLHTETFGQTGTPLLADFDGDRKADPTIVNSSGTWFVWLSGDGYTQASAPFAVSGATPVAADFDADGRADPVMVDASGSWYFYFSSYMYQLYGNRSYYFGLTGKPVAGDFDGDGKAEPGIVDSTGNWNLFLSARFYTRSGPWYLVLP